MLQRVSHEHDNHYLSSQSNSIEALVASKSDGKRHLLLAYAMEPPMTLLLLGVSPKTMMLTATSPQGFRVGSHHQEQVGHNAVVNESQLPNII